MAKPKTEHSRAWIDGGGNGSAAATTICCEPAERGSRPSLPQIKLAAKVTEDRSRDWCALYADDHDPHGCCCHPMSQEVHALLEQHKADGTYAAAAARGPFVVWVSQLRVAIP
jgi:hypothetical protein